MEGKEIEEEREKVERREEKGEEGKGQSELQNLTADPCLPTGWPHPKGVPGNGTGMLTTHSAPTRRDA